MAGRPGQDPGISMGRIMAARLTNEKLAWPAWSYCLAPDNLYGFWRSFIGFYCHSNPNGWEALDG